VIFKVRMAMPLQAHLNPDEQAVVIRQINGAVNGLQFRVQDLEDAVKTLQERLKR
jgi:hypothetical protein